ncbi:hypothetical protein H5410_020874 [Solanum commersonii]|uniref:Uncharacterized protein n=1 Tax=Solanum commersonii TaxID=4109 RepID=A0A9J5Z9P4_SOLCO|nr:hypothetical protein H5410_020874 [Solanum commersonii]
MSLTVKKLSHTKIKLLSLREKSQKMEQEIHDIKEMIADLKNSSIEDSLYYDLKDSSDEDLEGYSPIRATTYSNFDCNVQYFSNMHPRLPSIEHCFDCESV